ncbi:hypothetical protein B9Q04_16260 [Candidatus Marsarchaeota G2 archaeon BE_D]|jgi:hypothetical protein|uniref:Uncharacterized protein n=1 Tax=Candidatus Marsarchaeota G2 archaeon BE_D TaxID=1978158 RepID=A0A2R6C683_9ARCH|nr:MAG: hypothetical protein B9Q04_16260 [Candidatus Marsarchaeota G2 archaeon BE_D]
MTFNFSEAGAYQVFVEIRDSAGYTLVSYKQLMFVEHFASSNTINVYKKSTYTHQRIKTQYIIIFAIIVVISSLLLSDIFGLHTVVEAKHSNYEMPPSYLSNYPPI